MTVIAFRPRSRAGARLDQFDDAPFTGTFRTPLGRLAAVEGRLRVQRLVLVPSGIFVTGVFVAELREPDGTVIGVDSRRATVPADLVRRDDGLQPVVRASRIGLMGLELQIAPFPVDPRLSLSEGRTGPARPGGSLPRGHLRPTP